MVGGLGVIEDPKQEDDLGIELDDLVYFYPDISDQYFQGKIGSLLEFAELSGSGQEPIPSRNNFFEHQTFIHRFLREYDDILLIHPPGSGKTRSAGGSSEEYRRSFIAGTVDYTSQYLKGGKNQIKHVYVLVPGAVIKSEFEKQIICGSAREGDYDIAYLDEGGPSALTRRVNKLLGRFYTIETYSRFAKKINEENMTDQEITDKFSGSMFIIDEAHNLIPAKKGDFDKITEKSSRNILKGEVDGKGGTGVQKKMIYKMIAKVFHLAKRSKRILMTATPMINSTSEIIDLINLIIPNGQPKMEQIVNYDDHSTEQLKVYFGGRISFVPDLDTKVDAVYGGTEIKHREQIGNRMYTYKTIVEETKMLSSVPFILQQLEIERRITGNTNLTFDQWKERGGKGSGRENFGFNIKEWLGPGDVLIKFWQDDGYRRISNIHTKFKSDRRQAANFVFPDGSFGEKGFKKYRSNPESSAGDTYRPNPELKRCLSRLFLKRYSSKYARGIALIKSIGMGKITPIDEIGTELNWEIRPKGKVFCFSEQLRGSGIIIYGKALEENGYERFNQNGSVFGRTGKTGRSYCISKESEELNQEDRPMSISKGPRYAMLTGFTSKAKRETLLELFNSRENRYGDYIQVLLTSPVAQFGLNINDVVQIQLMEGGWHEAGHYQALSRSLRATSHVYLLNDAKKEAKKRGDSSEVRIQVNIYQHAAVDTEGGSVDLELYKASEGKAIRIEKLFNKMKTLSVDCHVHRFRQKRKGTTGKLLHDSTSYQCLPVPKSLLNRNGPGLEIDSSSYNVLYSKDDLDRAINFIYEMFKIKSKYKFKELGDKYQKIMVKTKYGPYFYDPRFILLAAEKIIGDNKEIVDKFGFVRYLQEDGKYLFLVEKYPLLGNKNSLGSAYYVQRLIGRTDITLKDVLNDSQRSEQNEMIEIIKYLPAEAKNILQLISGLNNASQVKLLEWAIIETAKRTNNPSAKSVMDKFNYYIFQWRDPVGLVNIVKNKRDIDPNAPRGRGRPRAAGNLVPIKFTTDQIIKEEYYPAIDNMGNPAMVMFHNLTGLGQDDNDYSRSSQNMTGNRKIRLLKIPEGLKRVIAVSDWRDLSSLEEPVYRHLAGHIIDTIKLEPLKKNKVYGRFEGGKFSIINNLKLKEGETDRRSMPRGKYCGSYSISELIWFLYHHRRFVLPSDRSPPDHYFPPGDPIRTVDKEQRIASLIPLGMVDREQIITRLMSLGMVDREQIITRLIPFGTVDREQIITRLMSLRTVNREQIISRLMGLPVKPSNKFVNSGRLRQMTKEELEFFYEWYVYLTSKNKKKEALCNILQDHLGEKNLLLILGTPN
uniref:Early transcription factor 70 kDa subunit n=1 Tax=Pithovirus LCPAC202 TaxID=2506592 RepID=A0A481Z7Z3_9VIRU|nr:MAG: uncharacterized protein LCPAC202_02240 [Pithovirus LCPAC202]